MFAIVWLSFFLKISDKNFGNILLYLDEIYIQKFAFKHVV